MTVGTLPTAPARTMEPATFAATADTFVAALPTLVSDINTTAASINASQTAAAASAAAASSSQTAANTSATNAAASATAAATAASAAAWVNGNTYALNASAISQVNFQTYRKITASSVTTTDPASDSTNWVIITGLPPVLVTRSSNTALTGSDLGKFISCTGTFTQTFISATTLGNSWYCYIRNSGSGDITLDPNSSETIDGLLSFIMYPGEVRLVIANAGNLFSFVLTPFYRVWTTTASNNFTKPPGYNYFEGLAWSGGASGARTGASSSNGEGGGGGGCFPFKIRAADLAATETITIGAGGAPSTTTTRNAGGHTSIGTKIGVSGAPGVSGTGYGGSVAIQASNPGNGGVQASGAAANGFDSQQSNSGGNAIWGGTTTSANGNTSQYYSTYGAGGGGSVTSSNTASPPGISAHAGQGGAASLTGNGSDGTIPGGGGGATQTGTQSGAGARGEVRMWGVC